MRGARGGRHVGLTLQQLQMRRVDMPFEPLLSGKAQTADETLAGLVHGIELDVVGGAQMGDDVLDVLGPAQVAAVAPSPRLDVRDLSVAGQALVGPEALRAVLTLEVGVEAGEHVFLYVHFVGPVEVDAQRLAVLHEPAADLTDLKLGVAGRCGLGLRVRHLRVGAGGRWGAWAAGRHLLGPF